MQNKRYWNRMLLLMGIFKIPMLGFVRPRMDFINDELAIVKIRLRRRSRNHLKSMYFGALAVGADTAAGILAFYHAKKRGLNPHFAFKSMSAQFIQRPMTDVYFHCPEGKIIAEVIEQSIISGERVNREVNVYAVDEEDMIVARFQMEISVKFK